MAKRIPRLYIWWCSRCRRQLPDAGLAHICKSGEWAYEFERVEVVPKDRKL